MKNKIIDWLNAKYIQSNMGGNIFVSGFRYGIIIMGTILLLVSIVSCDKEDSVVQCDCDITIASYSEAMQAYEPISQEFYSNNCEDHKPFYNPVGDGTYYSINCK